LRAFSSHRVLAFTGADYGGNTPDTKTGGQDGAAILGYCEMDTNHAADKG